MSGNVVYDLAKRVCKVLFGRRTRFVDAAAVAHVGGAEKVERLHAEVNHLPGANDAFFVITVLS
ncbi:hypothetical protein [Alkalicoccus luteus]|uniref:hypothetical protein n=1 Tax=Alkalicoccus luteus TaxID=1237094 RepID=UPI00143ADD0F|nr:hypothetical protein [Alkalicoccus luteus]